MIQIQKLRIINNNLLKKKIILNKIVNIILKIFQKIIRKLKFINYPNNIKKAYQNVFVK